MSSLRFLPKFNERDPDVFFFLCLSGWQRQEAGQILTKHCCCSACLKGKAYVSLGGDLTYELVKAAVLKVYCWLSSRGVLPVL